MFEKCFTTENIREAKNILQILNSVPEDKSFILSLMTEAFIDGMNVQEQLMLKYLAQCTSKISRREYNDLSSILGNDKMR